MRKKGGLRRKRTQRKKKHGGKKRPIKDSTLSRVLCNSTEAAAAAGCEMIGLGPEDPFADFCAYKLGSGLRAGCKTFVTEEGNMLKNMGEGLTGLPMIIGKKIFEKIKEHIPHPHLPTIPHLPSFKLPHPPPLHLHLYSSYGQNARRYKRHKGWRPFKKKYRRNPPKNKNTRKRKRRR